MGSSDYDAIVIGGGSPGGQCSHARHTADPVVLPIGADPAKALRAAVREPVERGS